MSYLKNQKTEIGRAQVSEALLRMKALNIHENAIREFESEGMLNFSEKGMIFGVPVGVLYWLDEEESKMVKAWEQETGNMVYHVIKDHTTIGVMYSFLYVSTYTEEWERDREDLSEGYALAYVKNMENEDFSEYGGIGIKPCYGGVIRTA